MHRTQEVKTVRKRLLHLLLCAALVLSLLAVPTAGASNLAFVAVNDTIPLTLSGGELPFYANGVCYVPYTVFSSVDIYPVYSATANTVTLTDRSGRLVYDLGGGTVTDENNTTQPMGAVLRNGIIFLPAAYSAAHFGVQCSVLTSSGGYTVVRFTTGSQVYDDGLFITKAENLIAYRVEQYESAQSKPEQPSQPDTSTPSTSQQPNQPGTTPDPEEPEEGEPVTVHLAITDGVTMDQSLALLQTENLPAVFFFTEQELLERPYLVRQITVAGYPIGLTVDDADNRPLEEALRAANHALDGILGRKALLCLLPETAEAASLESRYCVYYQPSARLTATAASKSHGESVLLICDSTQLSAGLTILQEAEASFAQLTETTVLS